MFPTSALLFCGLKGSSTEVWVGSQCLDAQGRRFCCVDCWAGGWHRGTHCSSAEYWTDLPGDSALPCFQFWGSGQWAHCHPAGISAGIMAQHFEILPFCVFPSRKFTVASVNLCLPPSNGRLTHPLFGRLLRSLICVQPWSQRAQRCKLIVPQGACLVLLSFNPLPPMGVLREMKNWVPDLRGGLFGGSYSEFNIQTKKESCSYLRRENQAWSST